MWTRGKLETVYSIIEVKKVKAKRKTEDPKFRVITEIVKSQ